MHRSNGAAIGALVVLAVGLVLVWLALPRTIAHSKIASDHHLMASLARGETAPLADLFAAIAQRRDALRWLDLGDAWNDIGALYLILGRRPGLTVVESVALLDQSVLAFGRGLALAPARPFAWVQLAQARHARNPVTADGLAAALRMSYATGPMEPRIVGQRVRIGYAARAVLQKDLLDRVSDDVRLWADHDPWRLASWARPHYALPWVRTFLAGDSALDGRFVTNYLRLPPR